MGKPTILMRSLIPGKPVLEGIAAVKKLLRGARTMKEGNAGFQRFSKLGSYEKALKDFNRLRPKSTNEIQGPNGVKYDFFSLDYKILILNIRISL